MHAFGVRVVVMEQTGKDDQQELVENLIAITTAFSARIYGKRGGKKVAATVRQAMATLAQEGISGAIKCLFKSATPICSPDLPNDS